MFALSQQQTEKAEAEFTQAVHLNSNSFLAYYFSARARMRYDMNTPEATENVAADLEKAIRLNPQFAPVTKPCLRSTPYVRRRLTKRLPLANTRSNLSQEL